MADADLARLLATLADPASAARELAYLTLERRIHDERADPALLRGMIEPLLGRLVAGLGDAGSATVFGRSFAALTLAEIVDAHNRRPFLAGAEVADLLGQVLDYAACERDRRGYVPGYGWANVVGHVADLLGLLAIDLSLGPAHLTRLLDGLGELVTRAGAPAFVCGEEERLARAALVVLHRDIVPLVALESWLAELADRVTADGAAPGEEVAWLTRQHNARAFLRALAYQTDVPHLAGSASTPPYLAALLVHRPAVADELVPELLVLLGRLSSL